MGALGNLLAFIVAISVLVAVHEYGHYIVGRWTGMKVLRFSIGFGKPIWTHIGAGEDRTEYCISAIPLGGYVKILGMTNIEDVAPEAELVDVGAGTTAADYAGVDVEGRIVLTSGAPRTAMREAVWRRGARFGPVDESLGSCLGPETPRSGKRPPRLPGLGFF